VQAQAGEGAEARQPVVRAKGRAGELGLDGHLRVVLEPIDMALAEQLPSRGGAPVLLTRGDRVGRVLSIVGTLQRPIATVELDAAVREHALALRGREVHIH
jgi:rRNA processing protein Gar1